MTTFRLSRYEIEQLFNFVNEYPCEDSVKVILSNQSGIGVNIVAEITYASNTRTDSRDITDYDSW